MATAVYLPKLGMTMEEGTLTRWLVADGQAVESGQPIFEMETEKVEIEVEADGSGVLKHIAAEGAVLPPGAIVGALLADGESEVPREILDRAGSTASEVAIATPVPEPDEPRRVADPAPAGEPALEQEGGRILASPAARRLARERGVELAAVTGSGPAGRITERDIEAHLEAASAPAPAAATATAPPETVPAPVAAGDGERLPYRGMRKTIGDRMHQSVQSMAQLTLVSEVRVDETMRMLHGLNREWREERIAVTLTAAIVRACGIALREHPRVNARLEDNAIVLAPEVHVGVAVNLDDGLIVPVVHHADRRSLKEVAQTVAHLSEQARGGHLAVGDVAGGTFSVTSLESYGVDAFTPIINPPQAAILGVGRVKEAAVVEGGTIERGRVTTLSLTFDHRVIDGAPAAQFLARVAELLERPYMLM
jgi:pyruvate dehydrogenase E2 component (dihydrolipoamide acetyltransferase)